MTATIRAAEPSSLDAGAHSGGRHAAAGGRGRLRESTRRRGGLGRPWGLLVFALATGLAVGLATSEPASAEIVILVDGSFLKVDGFRVENERHKVYLDLPSGGLLTLPLSRVSRILDDEISRAPAPEEPPGFVLRFREEQPVPDGPYGELIYQAAAAQGLNPALVSAVVVAESSYDPTAVSVKGAQGLMQLMPATAERFGLTGDQVFEPVHNIGAGSRYLRWLADRFDDDLARVLAAYNAGEGTVDRYDGVPPYRETRGYLRRIFRRLGLDPPPAALESSRTPKARSQGVARPPIEGAWRPPDQRAQPNRTLAAERAPLDS